MCTVLVNCCFHQATTTTTTTGSLLLLYSIVHLFILGLIQNFKCGSILPNSRSVHKQQIKIHKFLSSCSIPQERKPEPAFYYSFHFHPFCWLQFLNPDFHILLRNIKIRRCGDINNDDDDGRRSSYLSNSSQGFTACIRNPSIKYALHTRCSIFHRKHHQLFDHTVRISLAKTRATNPLL